MDLAIQFLKPDPLTAADYVIDREYLLSEFKVQN